MITVTRSRGRRGYRLPAEEYSRQTMSIHPWPDSPSAEPVAGVRTWVCEHRLSSNRICAERVALVGAVAAPGRDDVAIADEMFIYNSVTGVGAMTAAEGPRALCMGPLARHINE